MCVVLCCACVCVVFVCVLCWCVCVRALVYYDNYLLLSHEENLCTCMQIVCALEDHTLHICFIYILC